MSSDDLELQRSFDRVRRHEPGPLFDGLTHGTGIGARARAPKKEDALATVERWKARYPDAAAHLEPADVLVDAMRGRFKTWTRIRVNLQHVPETLRPAQEALDPDDTPNEWASAVRAAENAGIDPSTWRRRPSRARKAP